MATTLMSVSEWAAVEFDGAQLGDRRRQSRLIRTAASMASDPHGTLPESFTRWAQAKAAYRLLEQPDVTYDGVIAPHLERVRASCRQAGEYLLVEDTTTLDFTAHVAAQDLGASAMMAAAAYLCTPLWPWSSSVGTRNTSRR